ncbi:TPA: hypothetical protein EYP66_09010 [Candidatus Poribacteria bacterium]|nr:hypothetical protein [Candidatus Poribacteria bacterium]
MIQERVIKIASLLEELQRKIEKTYAMDTGIEDVGKFIIGDRTYRRLYGDERIITSINSLDTNARILIRQHTEPLRVSLYYPNWMIEKLERYDPRFGVYDVNIDEVAVFVEELDHLLLIGQSYKHRKPFSLLGLELHANITKYLVLSYFIANQMSPPRLNSVFRDLLKRHLFEENQYVGKSAQEIERYTEANRLAWKYINFLEKLNKEEYLQEIRKFNKLMSAEMVSYVEKVA